MKTENILNKDQEDLERSLEDERSSLKKFLNDLTQEISILMNGVEIQDGSEKGKEHLELLSAYCVAMEKKLDDSIDELKKLLSLSSENASLRITSSMQSPIDAGDDSDFSELLKAFEKVKSMYSFEVPNEKTLDIGLVEGIASTVLSHALYEVDHEMVSRVFRLVEKYVLVPIRGIRNIDFIVGIVTRLNFYNVILALIYESFESGKSKAMSKIYNQKVDIIIQNLMTKIIGRDPVV